MNEELYHAEDLLEVFEIIAGCILGAIFEAGLFILDIGLNLAEKRVISFIGYVIALPALIVLWPIKVLSDGLDAPFN